jgi:hypothetical protein
VCKGVYYFRSWKNRVWAVDWNQLVENFLTRWTTINLSSKTYRWYLHLKISAGFHFTYTYGRRQWRISPPPPLFDSASRLALEPTQPPIQWIPGREADHSPPSSAGVKNARSYISSHAYVFIVWCLMKQGTRPNGVGVKHRENFTLSLALTLLNICFFKWRLYTCFLMVV